MSGTQAGLLRLPFRFASCLFTEPPVLWIRLKRRVSVRHCAFGEGSVKVFIGSKLRVQELLVFVVAFGSHKTIFVVL